MVRSLSAVLTLIAVAFVLTGCPSPQAVDDETRMMRDSLLAEVQVDSFLVRVMLSEEAVEEDVTDQPRIRGMYSGSAHYETAPGTAEDPLTVRILLEGTDPEVQAPDAAPEAAQTISPVFEMAIHWETDADVMDVQEIEEDPPIEVMFDQADGRPNVRATIVEHGRNYDILDGELEITEIGAERIRGTFRFEIPAAGPPSPPPATPTPAPRGEGDDMEGSGASGTAADEDPSPTPEATPQDPDATPNDMTTMPQDQTTDQQEVTPPQESPDPTLDRPAHTEAGPRVLVGAFDASFQRGGL